MKLYGSLAILLSLAIVATLLGGGAARTNNWGRTSNDDVLLHSEHVEERARSDHIVTRAVVFELKSKSKKHITRINAIDNKPRNGGSASLMRGGVGKQSVTLHVESKAGKAIDYTIEIYGHK